MITGELEAMLADKPYRNKGRDCMLMQDKIERRRKQLKEQMSPEEYDNFLKGLFGGKNKTEKTAEQKQEAQKRRQENWGNITKGVAGDGSGSFGKALNNLFGAFKGGNENPDETSYQLSPGHKQGMESSSKGLPKEVLILGGIVVIGLSIWAISASRRKRMMAVSPSAVPTGNTST